MATKRRSCSTAKKPVAKKTATKKTVAKKPQAKTTAAKKYLVTTDAKGNIKTVKSV